MEKQESPLRYSPEMYRSVPREDILKWRLEGSDIIESIEHHLKGEFLLTKIVLIAGVEEAIQVWEPMPEAAFMNEIGAKAVVTTSTMMINKVIFLSDVSEDIIYQTCKDVELALANIIYNNWDPFNVTKRPDPIIHILMDLVFFGLMRAKGGGERAALVQTENIIRNITEGGKPGGWHFPLRHGGVKNEEPK